METDPRGQLGGLDTTDSVRKRMAAESHAFRCSVCSKTNLEIISEREVAAAETALEERTKGEVEIPPELKMGWKDELAPSTQDTEASQPSQPSQSSVATTQPATSSPAPLPAMQRQQPRPRQVTGDGVPRWLDQLIMALVVILAGLVINRVFN